MEQIIQAAKEYMETLLGDNRDGHGPDHALRVYRTAMEIADSEPEADRLIVGLSALLHDADDHKLFDSRDNENARRFLAAQGVDEETVRRVCAVINGVSFSRNRDKKPDTLEGQIVQDADRLDAMGAVGIARTFAYGGKHGRAAEDSIAHFHEKLLLLRDLLNTRKAKELGEERHAFLEAFLAEWDRETQGK